MFFLILLREDDAINRHCAFCRFVGTDNEMLRYILVYLSVESYPLRMVCVDWKGNISAVGLRLSLALKLLVVNDGLIDLLRLMVLLVFTQATSTPRSASYSFCPLL